MWWGGAGADHNSVSVLLVAMEISRGVVVLVVEEGYRRGQIIM